MLCAYVYITKQASLDEREREKREINFKLKAVGAIIYIIKIHA